MIYGSGLRRRRREHRDVPPYTPIQLRNSARIPTGRDPKPMTVRFDVVNLFDPSVYLIRNGSGIGVFAAQYGPRRGFSPWRFQEASDRDNRRQGHASKEMPPCRRSP